MQSLSAALLMADIRPKQTVLIKMIYIRFMLETSRLTLELNSITLSGR